MPPLHPSQCVVTVTSILREFPFSRLPTVVLALVVCPTRRDDLSSTSTLWEGSGDLNMAIFPAPPRVSGFYVTNLPRLCFGLFAPPIAGFETKRRDIRILIHNPVDTGNVRFTAGTTIVVSLKKLGLHSERTNFGAYEYVACSRAFLTDSSRHTDFLKNILVITFVCHSPGGDFASNDGMLMGLSDECRREGVNVMPGGPWGYMMYAAQP
ncbi:hypothetical protein FISHEDRAFT_70176 [Fistulina hepatica ATCC 64428]|uniref:Uncharacterized protein n=1 Tax=Fistulina hepatica ATCC 64428 TaxID=1128425 RepID=A0A0D7AN82_9AGAR|nr:hypothetical protein FISHEDRAFT_70176 [Fistulina hepatica ATCC 64428]